MKFAYGLFLAFIFVTESISPLFGQKEGDGVIGSQMRKWEREREVEKRRKAWKAAKKEAEAAHPGEVKEAEERVKALGVEELKKALNKISKQRGFRSWTDLVQDYRRFFNDVSTDLSTIDQHMQALKSKRSNNLIQTSDVVHSLIDDIQTLEFIGTQVNSCHVKIKSEPEKKSAVDEQFWNDVRAEFISNRPTEVVDSGYDIPPTTVRAPLRSGKEGLTYVKLTDEFKNLKPPSLLNSTILLGNFWSKQAKTLFDARQELPTLHFSDPEYDRAKEAFYSISSIPTINLEEATKMADSMAALLALSGIWSGKIAFYAERFLQKIYEGDSRDAAFKDLWKSFKPLPLSQKLQYLGELQALQPESEFFKFAYQRVIQETETVSATALAAEAKNSIALEDVDATAYLLEAFARQRVNLFEDRQIRRYESQLDSLMLDAISLFVRKPRAKLMAALIRNANDFDTQGSVLYALQHLPASEIPQIRKQLLESIEGQIFDEMAYRKGILTSFTIPIEEDETLSAITSLGDSPIMGALVFIRREIEKDEDFLLTPDGQEMLYHLDKKIKRRNQVLLAAIDNLANQPSSLRGSLGEEFQLRAELAQLRLNVDGNWQEALALLDGIKFETLSEGDFIVAESALRSILPQIISASYWESHDRDSAMADLNHFITYSYDPKAIEYIQSEPKDPETRDVLQKAHQLKKSLLSAINKSVKEDNLQDNHNLRTRIYNLLTRLAEAAKKHPEAVLDSLGLDQLIEEIEVQQTDRVES